MDTVIKPEYLENVDHVFVRESTEGMYAATRKEGKFGNTNDVERKILEEYKALS